MTQPAAHMHIAKQTGGDAMPLLEANCHYDFDDRLVASRVQHAFLLAEFFSTTLQRI